MFHSVTINGKNTWDNYHMVPANGIYLPTPPEQKRTTIDLKTGNGLLDVSTVLTGYPLFQNRSGELQYFILDPWDLEEVGIGGPTTWDAVKARVNKHFSGSDIDAFFEWATDTAHGQGEKARLTNDDVSAYFVTVILGLNETQTAIGIVQTGSVPNFVKQYITNNTGAKQIRYGGMTGSAQVYYLVTNGTYMDIQYMPGMSVSYTNYDVWCAPFTFNNIPTTGSGSGYANSHCPFPNVTNSTYDGSNGMTSYISRNVYPTSSSTEILYPKNLYVDSSSIPAQTHTMPNAYDVYSQLLNDIHGTDGTMIFEDDPYWYYQGHFTVKSMDTNSVRRGVSIGYEVSPYKLRTAQAAKILNSIDASTWASLTINEDELFSMPVIPSVNVSGTFNSESAVIRFVKPNGTYVEKTVTSSGTHTWPDVVFYKQATVQFKASAGKTVTMTFRPGRL